MTSVNVFSESQASVNSFIHQCNVVNANFDGTLNHIHHMVLAAGKENNEVYTFKEMLQQDDAKDYFIELGKLTHDERRTDQVSFFCGECDKLQKTNLEQDKSFNSYLQKSYIEAAGVFTFHVLRVSVRASDW